MTTKSLTYAQAAALYLAATAPRDRASTQHSKGIVIGRVVAVLGTMPIDRIGRTDLYALQAGFLAEKLAPRTVHLYCQKGLAVLRWCVAEGLLAELPRGFRLCGGQSEHHTSDRAVYEALLARDLSPVLRAGLLLCGDAGLRSGEARALRWASVMPDRIVVRHSTWRGLEGATKTGRARTVPTTARLRTALESMPHSGPLVLERPERVTRDVWLLDLMRRECRRAGLPEIKLHGLRHCFASELARRGASVVAIRDLLGHTSIATTNAYLSSSREDLQDTVALLETA